MKIKLYIIAVASLLTSCFSDFDALNPNAEIMTNTTSLKDTQKYLAAAYNTLYNQDLWHFDSTEVAADMAFPGGGDRYGVPLYEMGAKFYYQTYTNVLSPITNKYAAIYIRCISCEYDYS